MRAFIPYVDVWKYLDGVGNRHGAEVAYVKWHLILRAASFDTLGLWITARTWVDL